MATIKDRDGEEIEDCQVDTNTCCKKNDVTPPLVGLTTNLACNAYGTGQTIFQRNGSRKNLAETCNRQSCNPPCPYKTLSKCCKRVAMLHTHVPRPQFYANPPFPRIRVLTWS